MFIVLGIPSLVRGSKTKSREKLKVFLMGSYQRMVLSL